MPIRHSPVDRGLARGRTIVLDICRELEAARIAIGLSYEDLGGAVGLSGQQAARICRGQSAGVSIVRRAGLLAAVGLELSARAFPGGSPLRDAAHLALLDRFHVRVSGTIQWRVEAPVVRVSLAHAASQAGPYDRRAWDVLLEGPGWRVGVEAETRLGDIQALERRLSLKQRDGGVGAVILLVNDTAHNRRIISDDRARLRERFPGSARQAFHRLAAGLPPVADSLLTL